MGERSPDQLTNGKVARRAEPMRVELYLVLLLLATFASLWRGTRGEKWIGGTVLSGNLLTIGIEHALGKAFLSVSFGYLALDAVLAAVLCAIAVKYPSWVSICVSAFQINGTLGHLVKLLAPHTISFSYAFLLKFWAWPMVLAILIGRCAPRLHQMLRAADWPPLPS
jgi:hypothetical protein